MVKDRFNRNMTRFRSKKLLGLDFQEFADCIYDEMSDEELGLELGVSPETAHRLRERFDDE